MLVAMGNPDRNVSKGFYVGRFESSTAVGVVMALEHQIDVVLVKDWLPKRADLDVVPILCGREYRMMERADDPR